MKKILLFILSSLVVFYSNAQDFSNKGKDFWVGYGYHEIMVAGNVQDMVLYFANEYSQTRDYPRKMLDFNIASDYSKIRKILRLSNDSFANHVETLVRNRSW